MVLCALCDVISKMKERSVFIISKRTNSKAYKALQPAYRYSVYMTPFRVTFIFAEILRRYQCKKHIFSIIITFIIQFHLLMAHRHIYGCVCVWVFDSCFANSDWKQSCWYTFLHIQREYIVRISTNAKPHRKKTHTQKKERENLGTLSLFFGSQKPPNLSHMTFHYANETDKMIIIPFIHLKSFSHFPLRSPNLNKLL